MAGTLSHRGPDGLDVFIDRETQICGLAHCRLIVIDPVGGKQPLSNEDDNLWITYNGECYNFPELRQQLENAGHKFKTRSDTEVVLHLYQEYGPECVQHMRGMFAFAVWNRKDRQLFLARDRMGQKPIYFAVHQGRFIFASEPKAILESREFPRRVNSQAIMQYLLLGYVPANMCAFADIHTLPPAHTLTVNTDNFNQPTYSRYWQIDPPGQFEGTFDQGCEALQAELKEATRMRLISDVPLGAFLSGGIDSTIVVGLMSQLTDRPVSTCSIGFREKRYDETRHARHVAQTFGCDHEQYIVEPDNIGLIEKLSFYYCEPFADSSALPTCQLAAVAKPRVTVALTGDGGDECFGGYDRYRAVILSERIKRSRFLSWIARRKIWGKISTSEHHSKFRQLKRLMTAAALPLPKRYLTWMAVFNPDAINQICTDQWRSLAAQIANWDFFQGAFSNTESAPCELAGQAMHLDACGYLPGDLNTKIDRAGMAVGLELRCPFEDHKVVELAHSFPAAWRHNGSAGKVILRRAFTDLLPSRISARSKMGFGVPVGKWFRGPLHDMFVDIVLGSRLKRRGYFDTRQLELLFDQHKKGHEDHGHQLWALLMLELWHRHYIDN